MSVLEGEKKPEPKPVEPAVEQEVSNVEEVCVNYINEHLFSPAPFSVRVCDGMTIISLQYKISYIRHLHCF